MGVAYNLAGSVCLGNLERREALQVGGSPGLLNRYCSNRTDFACYIIIFHFTLLIFFVLYISAMTIMCLENFCSVQVCLLYCMLLEP